jgi:ankyrin repeat protein
MSAALEGRTEKVRAFLSRGADVNAKDGDGRTPLMFAVINMHYETVNVLLDYGADVNARANDGGTALVLAASCGDPRIVRALLNRGADTNAKFVQTNVNAMMLAVKYGYAEIIRLLKQAGSS